MLDEARLAREWLTDSLFLDTETTGLEYFDEIVQIAVLDADGQVLLDEYVRPHRPIHPAAFAVNRITDAMLEDAPTFDRVWPRLKELLDGRNVVCYNADFDARMIWQSQVASQIPLETRRCECQFLDAMKLFKSFYGLRKWQKLGDALDQMGIVRPIAAHSAAADAESVRMLVRKMAVIDGWECVAEFE